MTFNKILRLALISFLENEVIVASWGISNITINQNSLIFDVNAMKYKGSISVVTTNNSGYIVHIGKETYNNCSLDNLVSFIDSKIEYTPDYFTDLKKWIFQKDI